MRLTVAVTGLAVCIAGALAQANFGDSSSSSGSESADQANTDTRFLGIIPGLSTGSANTDNLINGGLLGAGLVGGAGLLTGAINPGVLTGGLGGNPCGRRKRQANGETNTKFFLPNNNCNNPCGRRKRQAAGDGNGEDKTNTRFFLGGNNNNCGFNNGGFNSGFNSNPCGRRRRQATEGGNSTSTRFFLGNNNNGCGGGFNNGGFNGGFNNGGFNNGGFNNGGFNNGGFNGGFNNGGQGCQCTQLTINNGREGACRSRDNTGRAWCYTTGYGGNCGDYQNSQQYPSNPWSYNACNNQFGK